MVLAKRLDTCTNPGGLTSLCTRFSPHRRQTNESASCIEGYSMSCAQSSTTKGYFHLQRQLTVVDKVQPSHH